MLLGSAAPDPGAIRQLWGLTVRSERALRATAPLWPAQQAAWGEAAHLLANITEPASWLSQAVWLGSALLPASAASASLARLLLSCAATELKAARVAGLQHGIWILDFVDAAVSWESSSVASTPTVISLLLPRFALSVPTGNHLFACDAIVFVGEIGRAMAHVGCSPLTLLLVLTSCHMSVLLSRSIAEATALSQATHQNAHWAVAALAIYAINFTQTAVFMARQGRGSLSRTEVRARLAQPFLSLLRSPLLDLLASLQHVVVDSCTGVQSFRFPEGSDILPVHLLPAHLEPDALDSKVALQVGTCPVLSLFREPCHWLYTSELFGSPTPPGSGYITLELIHPSTSLVVPVAGALSDHHSAFLVCGADVLASGLRPRRCQYDNGYNPSYQRPHQGHVGGQLQLPGSGVPGGDHGGAESDLGRWQHLPWAALPDGRPDQVPGGGKGERRRGAAVPQADGKPGMARPSSGGRSRQPLQQWN